MKVKNGACIRKLSRKTLWASRKRNLIAIAAIALTALLFTSLFTITMSILESSETYNFRQAGGYNHGTFKEVNEEQAAAIAAHPKVKATGLRTVGGYAETGVFAKSPGEVSYMDENCTSWSYAKPTTGRVPRSGKEITMDTNALSLLGVEPVLGAEVTFSYTVGFGEPGQYEKTDTFTLVGWWDFDGLNPVHYLNVSEDYIEDLQKEAAERGVEPFRSDLNVMMASSLDIEGQMEQVDRDLGYTWDQRGAENNVRIGVNWGYTSEQALQNLDAGMVLGIGAFLALVIFTGYLVIYNIFQISVTGDIRFYGLLKTIGTTPRQLKRIIRYQALSLCVAGIPLGLLLGYGIGALLVPVVMSMSNLSEGTTVSASPVIFLFAALFALVTVLLSCGKPGKIAARVSPVEAVRYTDANQYSGKSRRSRRTGVLNMAFANLGRNKRKTALVLASLSLAVVLLNVLTMFVGGFDMEKYLSYMTCADFIVSTTDYFRFNQNHVQTFISQEQIKQIEENTQISLSGLGYCPGINSNLAWMTEEEWYALVEKYDATDVELMYNSRPRRDGLLGGEALIEGLDESLFGKLQVVEGDIAPLLEKDSHGVALAVNVDDYGNVYGLELYPKVGEQIPVSYVTEWEYVDSRTGEPMTEVTSMENLEQRAVESRDVTYTVCALVVVPRAMSYRYSIGGYELILSKEALEADSGAAAIPMVYLFDTPNLEAEEQAEAWISEYTAADPELMYNSKATIRAEFSQLQNIFLLLGGLLCFIIGVVGILNFFNAIMTGILSRQREFAVLQAVGMTGRQLENMIVYEGLLYALGSALAALLLSLALNPLAGNGLESIWWFFTARFTILPVLGAVPVFALLGWGIPTIMYRYTGKKSIVERLRETE